MLLFPPKRLPFLSLSSLPVNLISDSLRQTLTLTLTRRFPSRTFYGDLRGLPGVSCCSDSGCAVPDEEFEVELGRLLALLPEEMRGRIRMHHELRNLIEVVMDLGRKPLARFPDGDFELSECPITFQDIEFATSQVGDFAIDNRAGTSHTLHRISAIRNRRGAIIGLTCRVGRAITGSADLLRDLIKDGASLLLIGPPGVGKTTIIREIARMLSDDYRKRVMIVDTSNEIGGDGDIPHAGIGSARRMQVPNSDMQHMVLIEAVENHMPQVIVIDEIGTKLEAMAASTISQRGIQLVATAHGITIENVIKNPTLDMLIGGIQSVTLGDEEACRRRVQKTVLERKGPPTFSSCVELISKSELRVHRNLEATVDAILSGRAPNYELRKMNRGGLDGDTTEELVSTTFEESNTEIVVEDSHLVTDVSTEQSQNSPDIMEELSFDNGFPVRIFLYGILEATMTQAVRKLNLDEEVELTDNISDADVLLALQSRIKKNPRIQAVAESYDMPIYVTKTSSLVQVTKALRTLMTDQEDGWKESEREDKLKPSENLDALEEARLAIEQVVIPKGEPVELLPRPPHILSLQVDLVEKYHLQSEIIGMEPETRLRIYPYHLNFNMKQEIEDGVVTDPRLEDYMNTNGNADNSLFSSNRLPMLPD